MDSPLGAVDRLRSRLSLLDFDLVLGVLVGLVSLVTVLIGDPGNFYDYRPVDAYVVAAAVLSGAVITQRRRRPLAVHVVVLLCASVPSWLDYNPGAIPIAVVITTFTVAGYGERRQAVTGLLLVMAALLLLTVAEAYSFEGPNSVGTFVIYAGAWVVGDIMRTRRLRLEAAEQRACEMEQQKVADADLAVAEERLRIAQELHDVVAHAMSVIAIQSGVAAHVLDREPIEGKRALRVIEHTSREALQELRRMLGVLRDPDRQPGTLAPTPSLADLEPLVERFRALGLDVSLRLTDHEGHASHLTPSLGLNAYRLVQEALTNVLRHAGPATARVDVEVTAGAVRIEVVDDGLGGAATFVDGAGHGIVGMRERVALFGGRLDAGPRPEGRGFRVRAVLAVDNDALTPTGTRP